MARERPLHFVPVVYLIGDGGSRFLASGMLPVTRYEEGRPVPMASRIRYCGPCGRVFARLSIDNDRQGWLGDRAVCERCGSGRITPSYAEEFRLADLPPEVLRWEFDRHIEWLERTGVLEK